VTHIKQQKNSFITARAADRPNTRSLLYPRPLWWKYFCCFICVTLLWTLHIVIKQTTVFTFIFAVFLLNLTYSFRQTANAVSHFSGIAVKSSGYQCAYSMPVPQFSKLSSCTTPVKTHARRPTLEYSGLITCKTNEQFFVFSPSFFQFWFWPHRRNCRVILRQHATFHQCWIIHGRNMTSYRFSRWRPLWRNFTSLSHFFRRSMSISIPNIVGITQSVAEI